MNIGKLSFNEIVKATFDQTKIKFATIGLFVILLVAMGISYLESYLFFCGIAYSKVKILDLLSGFITAILALIVSAGIAVLVKGSAGKAKIKNSPLKVVLGLIWKILGLMIIYLVIVAAALSLGWLVGLVVRLPFAGVYLMALLSIPLTVFFAYLAVYAGLSGKFFIFALIENPKKSLIAISKDLIMLNIKNGKKIMFNGLLMLLPILFLLLAIAILLVSGFVMYAIFGWYIPGMAPILGLSIQGGMNLLAFLVNISGAGLIAYALAHVLVMFIVSSYSIYLDASK